MLEDQLGPSASVRGMGDDLSDWLNRHDKFILFNPTKIVLPNEQRHKNLLFRGSESHMIHKVEGGVKN